MLTIGDKKYKVNLGIQEIRRLQPLVGQIRRIQNYSLPAQGELFCKLILAACLEIGHEQLEELDFVSLGKIAIKILKMIEILALKITSFQYDRLLEGSPEGSA